MADVTIQINTPILTGSDYFKVRYREYPSGAFGAYSNRTNSPFTLIGLSAGQYELEVILVKDGAECPAILKLFTVVDPFECLEFEAEIKYNTSQTALYVELDYILPTPFTNPPCGWHIQAIGATTNKVVNYTTLPTPPIKIAINNNEALFFKVIADLCDGKTETCFESDLTPPPEPCTGITINSVTANWVQQIGIYNRFNVVFNFTQSVPPTTGMIVTVNQLNVIAGSTGLPGSTGYSQFNPLPVSPTATSFSVLIDMNSNVFLGYYDFQWMVVDRCGNKFTGQFSVQL